MASKNNIRKYKQDLTIVTEELHEAVSSVKGKTTKPVSPGLLSEDVKILSNLTLAELLGGAEESTISKRMFKAFSSTFLTHIPSEEHTVYFGSFRPNSLCNQDGVPYIHRTGRVCGRYADHRHNLILVDLFKEFADRKGGHISE